MLQLKRKVMRETQGPSLSNLLVQMHCSPEISEHMFLYLEESSLTPPLNTAHTPLGWLHSGWKMAWELKQQM